MADLQSRIFQPDPAQCCEACVFGRGEHAEHCKVSYKHLGIELCVRDLLLAESDLDV